jgi:ligand-binding sensor domain-containing protein
MEITTQRTRVAFTAIMLRGRQPEEALNHFMLRSLAQTPAGLVWAGTDEGVYRFDGTQVVSLNELRRWGLALPPVLYNTLLATPNGSL